MHLREHREIGVLFYAFLEGAILEKGSEFMSQDELDKGWTIKTYVMHNEAMRAVQEKLNTEQDRRYAEVNIEKEKALKIKETADLAALSLARESQVYKDQQADVMREKNLAASGVYATNSDLTTAVDKIEKALKPVFEFISSQQGMSKGGQITMGKIFASIAATGTIIGTIIALSVFLTR